MKHVQQKLPCAAASTLTRCQMLQNALEHVSRTHRERSPPVLFGYEHVPPLQIKQCQITMNQMNAEGLSGGRAPSSPQDRVSSLLQELDLQRSHAECAGDTLP